MNNLKEEFEMLSLEGLCTFVPPSYMEGFAEKHPSIVFEARKYGKQMEDAMALEECGRLLYYFLKKKG